MPVRPEPGSIGSVSQNLVHVQTGAAVLVDREFVVRLVNEGPVPFSMRYLTKIYEIDPGESEIVQWEVMVSFVGDPNAVNTPRVRERDLVFKKLRMKYGAYDSAEDWEANKPHLGVFSVVNPDHRIITVVDDPEGVMYAARVPSADADTEALRLQVQSMGQQLLMLQQMVADREGAKVTEAPIGTPPMAPFAAPDAGLVLDPALVPVGSPVAPPMVGAGGPGFVAPLPATVAAPGNPPIFDAPPATSVPMTPGNGATADEPGVRITP